jgi:inhibitor of KinA sporulation pathway (predicted exonuclease)
MKNRYINVIDIECTCWDGISWRGAMGKRGEIIEVGIAVIDRDGWTVQTSEAILVKPSTQKISEFCTNLTTITQDMIDAEGISFAAMCKRLTTQYDAHRRVWCSWGDFDREAFQQNCKWIHQDYPLSRNHINIKTLFLATYGETGNQKICGESIGAPHKGTHHRGIDDAIQVADILIEILNPDEAHVT